jgi:hypothetical protein
LRAIPIAVAPAINGADIAALDPAKFFQVLSQGSRPSLSCDIGFGGWYQNRETPHLIGLLRAGRDGPTDDSAAEGAQEITPFHAPPPVRVSGVR